MAQILLGKFWGFDVHSLIAGLNQILFYKVLETLWCIARREEFLEAFFGDFFLAGRGVYLKHYQQLNESKHLHIFKVHYHPVNFISQ